MRLMMADRASGTGEERLTLRSQIADLALVPPWIEHLASEYAISASTQFAMNLCLEEVLSNIIRHGYANKPDRPITVRFAEIDHKSSMLVIDDEAAPFNPIAADEIPFEETLEGNRIGGLGLRLLRNFATTINYESTPTGNRLSLGFSAAQ